MSICNLRISFTDVRQAGPTACASPLNPLTGKKLDTEHPARSTPNRGNADVAWPSLEDVLLKGVPVRESEVDQTSKEVKEEESISPETKFDFDQDEGLPDAHISDVEEHLSTPKHTQTRIGNRKENFRKPRTPVSEKPVNGTPNGRLPPAKPPANALDLDTEFADLTDEDIREVLETLRARRSKKQLEPGLTGRSQMSKRTTPVVTEEESSAEDIEVPVLREIPSRSKVKFDEKLRFKSASLESLPVQETNKSIFLEASALAITCFFASTH